MTLGTFATAACGLVARAMRDLRLNHSQLRVGLEEIKPHVALPRVTRGDLDLAIVQDWFNEPTSVPDSLTRAALLDDVADVAVPEGNPLAARGIVDIEDLDSETWITWSDGWICTGWLRDTLCAYGIEPDVSCTAAAHQTQQALVSADLGIAISPRLGRDPVPEGIRFVEIRPRLVRHIYAVWRTDASRRPSIRAVVQGLRQLSHASTGT